MKKQSKLKSVLFILFVAVLIGVVAWEDAFGYGWDVESSADRIKLGLDLAGGVSITYQAVGDEAPSGEDMSDTVYKLQRRVENYSTEAVVYQGGNDRISIEIPGVSDANTILQELGRPGTLYFIAQTDEEGNQNYTSSGYGYSLNHSIEELEENGSVVLTGIDVSSARAGSSQDSMGNSQYVVSLTLTPAGTEKFAKATKKAYENGESIAIYYDESFVSVPRVQAVISDGSAQITGMEDYEAAENLASTIRIGGLKVQLEELSSNVVGAQLGEQAIQTGLYAGLVGLIIILVIMIAIYRLPGLAADIALLLYVALMVLLLSAFEITLTLPGIAGIILSIGMAVDANVIIFARIKEEIGLGKSVGEAVKNGFDKALSAILDGNITTLIAAIVLGVRGSGSIRGFAQTLALGIILSMLTALFVTRGLLNAFISLGGDKPALYGSVKKQEAVKFVEKKNVFYIISAVMIVGGFVAMGMNAGRSGNPLNYSLEFIGGTATSITFSEDMSLEQIDSEVKPLFTQVTGDANIQASKVAGSSEVMIKSATMNVAQREELVTLITETFDIDEAAISQETISSTVSAEMRTDAVVAVVIASLLMLVYIWFRFKDIRFGAGSVAALIHDCLVVLAFYAVSWVSVGSTFIACMLTIVGYSINATIVIYDRIRENLAVRGRNADLALVVNDAVTQTLSRSIFTSLTTFVMVCCLYVFGVPSIKEFALPLMAGIVCGAYSSVCLAGALWYTLRKKAK